MSRGEFDYEPWFFDTGATVHVTNSDTHLYNIKYLQQTMRVADNTLVTSEMSGDLTLEDIKGNKITLLNIQYVPKFAKNIISGSRLLYNTNYQLTISKPA